jgi:HSP20 family protein
MSNSITRWNPLREMATMQNMMDRFFEDWRPFSDDFFRSGANALALDVHEDDRTYTVSTELPGVKPEEINVRQEGDYLVIEAETRSQTEGDQNKRPLMQERRYGHYSRRLRLPQNVDFSKADANYDSGVLTLTLPKSPEAQPHTIQVHVGQRSGNKNT